MQGKLSTIKIVEADLDNSMHQAAIVAMMDAYSNDPMGDAKPLSAYARENLITGLQDQPTVLIFLVFDEQTPCGIATCFRGFSTFAAKPLINISDFYLEPKLRGSGIGHQLLTMVEKEAISIGCCKLTLEVQQNNTVAQSVYGRFGFSQAVYAADADSGGSLYMVKQID